MKEYATCPNCNAKIKDGVFSSNKILNQPRIDMINSFTGVSIEAYCEQCGNDIVFNKIKPDLQGKISYSKERAKKLINSIPVITLQSPYGWEYEVLGIVTGQSTTGTGVFSEMFSSVTDLFGTQSGSYNTKLKNGENLCFAQLRKQALDLGANAVIGTDIDYSEMGGDKGMIMVCTAGTAVIIKNTEILGFEKAGEINELGLLFSDIKKLTKDLALTDVA